MRDNKHYSAIAAFYGSKQAIRSGLPLINHINQGLQILDAIGSSTRAKEAFCIHPMLQDDEPLQGALQADSEFAKWALDPAPVVLAMEYRSVANAYLSQHFQGDDDPIALSVVAEVNHMLIADKVQNRKDFEIYHLGSHPNSDVLARYFQNWLRRLGISEGRYRELADMLGGR
jgi:hypothetical protein